MLCCGLYASHRDGVGAAGIHCAKGSISIIMSNGLHFSWTDESDGVGGAGCR